MSSDSRREIKDGKGMRRLRYEKWMKQVMSSDGLMGNEKASNEDQEDDEIGGGLSERLSK